MRVKGVKRLFEDVGESNWTDYQRHKKAEIAEVFGDKLSIIA